MKLLLVFLGLLAPAPLFAFPEMVRNGYVNCMACHASPTGGGLLTQYGRGLSKELLSHSGSAEGNEESFLHGAVTPPSWLNLGGDLRALQLYQDTENYRETRFIVMQFDGEAAADYKRVSLLAAAGAQQPPKGSVSMTDALISRRHWLLARLGPADTPDLVQARAGRFLPAYGLNIPDHTAVTRRSLGFDEGQETYNAELSYIDENLNLYLTGIAGRPDAKADARRQGAAFQASVPWGTTRKIGVSAYTGQPAGAPDSQALHLVGAHAALGLSAHHYALFEVDGTQSVARGWGSAEYLKLGWELTQGFQLYASQQFARDLRTPELNTQAYDLGALYYPRAHWEFSGALEKERNSQLSRRFDLVAWLIVHYYL